MNRVILDTDVLSAILRGNPAVLSRSRDYLAEHGKFTISVITRYEILKGLHAKEAHAQIQKFHRFCSVNDVLPVDDDVALKAAELIGDLIRKGQAIGDADALIGASALLAGLGVSTGNIRHFNRIPGLSVENWLA